jgi:hypothetical protein
MLVSRLLTSLMGVDSIQLLPTFSDELSWIVPVWSLEAFLIGSVLLFEWVESERLKRDLGDHRGAAGRFVWAAMIIVISFGPAGIIAVVFTFKNAIKWVQPAVPVGLALFLPISWNALGNWIEIIDDTTALFMITIGMIGLIAAVVCVVLQHEVWVAASLWIGHLLIPTGAFGHYEHTTVLMMVLLLAVSTTSWLIGVITLRRAWRVIGAIDLLIAWIIAGTLMLAGATEVMVLIMLMATAILLGLVTWLGQKYENEISNT